MPEYLAPGVYVEETSFRAKSIEGVATSTAGFVGQTRFGPTAGLPSLVTGFEEFQRLFGDGKPAVARPAAAAWLLAGNKLSRRWCVWPRSEDCLRTCCNPAHLRSGSRGQHTKIATAASADLRAINLAVASARGNQAKAAPVEKVREAEALFDAGATIHAVVAATGICKTTASKIRAGKHMFSRGRAGHMAANSSIFAFARAA